MHRTFKEKGYALPSGYRPMGRRQPDRLRSKVISHKKATKYAQTGFITWQVPLFSIICTKSHPLFQVFL